VASVSRWEKSDASVADVAPIGAAVSHISHTVSAGVDDELSVEANSAHLLLHELNVVELGVGSIPLTGEIAGVLTARLVLIVVIEAVIVSFVATFPWTHLTDRLVVGDVCCEATELLVWQISDDFDECSHVVSPSEPSTMSTVKIKGRMWCSL